MYKYINKEKQERVNLENELIAQFNSIIENLKNGTRVILFDFFRKFQDIKINIKLFPSILMIHLI